ncbi:MAG: rRNA maturation RNase YbeY [Solitalea-like symbiont of Acarus siro]
MIRFFKEDIKNFHITNKTLLKSYIKTIISDHYFKTGEINYIFCSDNYLLNINITYLNHDYYTDIITFNNSTKNKILDADIFISIDRLIDNASILKETISNEILRVIYHGVLHLVGYNDKTDSDQAIMKEKENYYLSLTTRGKNDFFLYK